MAVVCFPIGSRLRSTPPSTPDALETQVDQMRHQSTCGCPFPLHDPALPWGGECTKGHSPGCPVRSPTPVSHTSEPELDSEPHAFPAKKPHRRCPPGCELQAKEAPPPMSGPVALPEYQGQAHQNHPGNLAVGLVPSSNQDTLPTGPSGRRSGEDELRHLKSTELQGMVL